MALILGSIAGAVSNYLGSWSTTILHEPAYDKETKIFYGAGILTKGKEPRPLLHQFLNGELPPGDLIAYTAKKDSGIDGAIIKMNGSVIEIDYQGIHVTDSNGKRKPNAADLGLALKEVKRYGNQGYTVVVDEYVPKNGGDLSQGHTLAPREKKIDVTGHLIRTLEERLREN